MHGLSPILVDDEAETGLSRVPVQGAGMTIYAVDPGTKQSAIVWLAMDGPLVDTVMGEILPNNEMLYVLGARTLSNYGPSHLVIEQIESMGMAVGREVFETVFASGRFAQAWESNRRGTWSMLPRRAVKLALCGSMKAKDTNIRQALLDRYGGAASAKKGGPLYGLKSHMWSALAIAETYKMQQAGL